MAINFVSIFHRMNFRRLIRLLILGALFFYFVLKVIDSVYKLQEGKIGTLFRKITEDLVEGRRQCYCRYHIRVDVI